MLITNLGNTRRRLLASLAPLAEATLQRPLAGLSHTPAQILQHLAAVEKDLALRVLAALPAASPEVDDRTPEKLRAYIDILGLEAPLPACSLDKSALTNLLEESRFRYLQAIFNETHEAELWHKSAVYPPAPALSLKNVVDLIWIHEQYHAAQLEHAVRTAS